MGCPAERFGTSPLRCSPPVNGWTIPRWGSPPRTSTQPGVLVTRSPCLSCRSWQPSGLRYRSCLGVGWGGVGGGGGGGGGHRGGRQERVGGGGGPPPPPGGPEFFAQLREVGGVI